MVTREENMGHARKCQLVVSGAGSRLYITDPSVCLTTGDRPEIPSGGLSPPPSPSLLVWFIAAETGSQVILSTP